MTDLSDKMDAIPKGGYRTQAALDHYDLECEIVHKAITLPLHRTKFLPKARLTHIIEMLESLRAELEGDGKTLAERRQEWGLDE